MNTSDKGIDFICSYEKLHLKAYLPTKNDRWTIGYGCTYYEDGSAVKEGDEITEQRAKELFRNILKIPERVTNRLNLPNQCMFDSIVSLVFNIGEGNFTTSTLRKVILASCTNYLAIKEQFNRWVYQKGVKLDGLVDRRAKEFKIYSEDIYINHV